MDTRLKRNLSDHFDGKVFHNPKRASHGLMGVLKWALNRNSKPWPPYRPTPPHPVTPPRCVLKGVRATFVNHATVLIQADGVNLLTDPVWSQRCSPVQFAGPRRVRDAGTAFEDLPLIHLVLISHNHYDHFDSGTVRRLVRDHDPIFIFGLGHESLAKRHGIQKAVFLDWWESHQPMGLLPLTFVPAQHFSGRTPFDRDRCLWGGYVLKTSAGPVYFAGDTGYGPQFPLIAERFGPPTLALLPIGAYQPKWFMGPVHMDPGEAVKAHLDLKAKSSMGIHFGTFKLSDEGLDQPVEDLKAALLQNQVTEDSFWIPEFGDGRTFGV